jgi:rhodanese-related sulfurtransferase
MKTLRVEPGDVKRAQERGTPVTFLDVRNPTAWGNARRAVPGALRMTVDDVEKRAKDLPKDAEVVAYCT